MRTLTLYGKPGCGLCDEMKEVIEEVAAEIPLALEHVDITTDPGLERRYGLAIPVLLVDGREAFRHRVSARELRLRLRRT